MGKIFTYEPKENITLTKERERKENNFLMKQQNRPEVTLTGAFCLSNVSREEPHKASAALPAHIPILPKFALRPRMLESNQSKRLPSIGRMK